MKLGTLEYGLAKKANGRKRRKRRNTTATAKAAPRRRNVSLASAKAVLKRNGLKATSLSNPRRKHHKKRKRRNGLATVPRRSNGFFGNTKSDATQVLQLGAGALGVKAVGRGLSNIVAPWLAQVGLGGYAGIITDGALALFVAPWVADKISRGSSKMVRLGGLLTVALDGVEMFAPGVLSFNPFNNSPVVMTPAGAAVAPAAVAQIAADVEAGRTSAAKVGNVMYQLDAAGGQGGSDNYAGVYESAPELVL